MGLINYVESYSCRWRQKRRGNALFTLVISLLFTLATTSSLHKTSQSNIRKPTTRLDEAIIDEDTLTCRISTLHATYQGDTDESLIREEEHLVCISIVDGRYGKHNELIVQDVLPSNFYTWHEKAINRGELYIRLRGVEAIDGRVVASIGKNVTFELIKEPEFTNKRRQLQNSTDPNGDGTILGNMTLAVVRVIIRDSEPQDSSEMLQQHVLSEQGNTIITQYRAMSFGQFNLQPAGVYEVFLDRNVDEFAGPLDLHEPITAALEEKYGLQDASELADKVFFCIPPGIAFIAFTSRWYWRTMLSTNFCTGLATTVHEFGHMIGLGHSNLNADGDYGDLSCYMGRGGNTTQWPRQSFNGFKHWRLGWFRSRHLQLDPFENAESILIDLAAFVDFDKTTIEQPVIVAIGEAYFLQYNRATRYNIDSRDARDTVTVTYHSVGIVTLRNAALNPTENQLHIISNYNGSGRDLFIHVCEQVMGDGVYPDVMKISIGFDSVPPVACNYSEPSSVPSAPPSSAPSTRPSSTPSVSPSSSPIASPSASPSYRPSASPSASPSSVPSTKPSSSPSQFPSSDPSTAPSPAPSVSPSSSPSSTPSVSPSASPSSAPSTKPTTSPSQSPSSAPSASQFPTITPMPTEPPALSPAPTDLPLQAQPLQTPHDQAVVASTSSADAQLSLPNGIIVVAVTLLLAISCY